MKNSRLLLLLGVIIASASVSLTACKKLNDATALGGDLIPAVDNINTFDTTIDVETYNDIFTLLNDTTRAFPSDEYFLGRITNDPIFGTTDAEVFFELKPPVYRYSFANIPHPDSLILDSVVLVMSYLETYGDTIQPQLLNVYEITSDFRSDSNYLVNTNTVVTGGLLGSRTIVPANLKDSVKVPFDTTARQLRIPLSNAFGQRLLFYDSIGPSGAYSSDSAFKTKFKGFAVKSQGGGNAIMGFNLQGANTKLAIYYRYQKGGTGIAKQDTTVNYFTFNTISGSANYVRRTLNGTVTSTFAPGEDPLVYIQSTPGTFSTIKIPDLLNVNNRLIHRAELIMEQIFDPSDTLFPHPSALMLDAYDPAKALFRTIPYDFVIDQSSGPNWGSFGVLPTNKLDANGNVVKIWKFNLSRYVQHRLTNTVPLYDLRVFAPYYEYEEYGIPPNGTDIEQFLKVNPSTSKGRVRLGGGNHPTQRMRLRLVYSKI